MRTPSLSTASFYGGVHWTPGFAPQGEALGLPSYKEILPILAGQDFVFMVYDAIGKKSRNPAPLIYGGRVPGV